LVGKRKDTAVKQLERFKAMAKELGADETGVEFERALRKIVIEQHSR
jgi:hypothetical protein